MDVAPSSVGSCDNSPLRRRLAAGASISQEFEFGMCALAKSDLFVPAADLAPADVIFFQGQLLPLQQPDLCLQHTNEASRTQERQQGRSGCSDGSSNLVKRNECLSFSSSKARAEMCLPCIAEHGLEETTRGVGEEARVCTVRDGAKVISEKERFYGRVVDDSVSSSFRSNSGSSDQKGSSSSGSSGSSSTSSSRCSNGSLQDSSYFNGELRNACCDEETVDPQLQKRMKTRWSWKCILSRFTKKASKIWVDRAEQDITAHKPHRSSLHFSFPPWPPRAREKAPSCPPENRMACAKFTAPLSNSLLSDPLEAGPRCVSPSPPPSLEQLPKHTQLRPPINTHPSLPTSTIPSLLPSQPPTIATISLDPHSRRIPTTTHPSLPTCTIPSLLPSQPPTIGTISLDPHSRILPTTTHPPSPSPTNPKLPIRTFTSGIPKPAGVSWNLKQGWKRCLRMVKEKPREPGIASSPYSNSLHNDSSEVVWFNPKAKSSSTTPVSKSPARICHDFAQASSKFNVGCASCPTSMCSSPHHSGVLSVVNKGASSTLNDLHIVIQDAITHCKASQTQNPTSLS